MIIWLIDQTNILNFNAPNAGSAGQEEVPHVWGRPLDAAQDIQGLQQGAGPGMRDNITGTSWHKFTWGIGWALYRLAVILNVPPFDLLRFNGARRTL